ncbi:HD-GYP domain-containing protein [Agaribacterium sp. ZY112]|uniref:HD-GYP domain-containing protein n=1 Tax=Agaribacterium sp. ZY112 TaxID=3233574 RepID=UPI003524EB3B
MRESTKIHVGELRIGMYVTKLDRDWLDTPFIMQGFLIEEPEDVDIVAEYCEHVWVDSAIYKAQADVAASGIGTASQHRTQPYEYQSDLQEEHKKAYKAFRHARTITFDLLNDIRLGGSINTDVAKDTVNDVVQSIIRHPDAMLWLSKIREESTYTSDHCLNVCVLAVAFGRQLGMDASDLEKIGLCGLLHDVGKMRVPEEILNKPASLTTKEMALMKSHTVHGRNLLLQAPNVYTGTIDVAYSHHERLDGTGYPRKLQGASIARFARIIAIVDSYDAMTANRCYSGAMTSTDALKEIYANRGTQFDAELALEFIKTIGLYPPGSLVELYTGEIGFVIEANPRLRHLPKVILLLDENRREKKKQKVLDLSFIECGELSRQCLIKQVWPDGSFGLHVKTYQDQGLKLKY